MSKAEELAKELLGVIDGPVFHVPHYMARQAAAELRRLAQVEAEHEALKKAISDAVPVAEITSWTNGSYWRNYKVNWIGLLEKGTKIIPLPERKS